VKEMQGDAEAQNQESSETEEQSQPRIQTLVRVLLETGRKHQIRAQLAHIGESKLRHTRRHLPYPSLRSETSHFSQEKIVAKIDTVLQCVFLLITWCRNGGIELKFTISSHAQESRTLKQHARWPFSIDTNLLRQAVFLY
jgi:hypothetical protein